MLQTLVGVDAEKHSAFINLILTVYKLLLNKSTSCDRDTSLRLFINQLSYDDKIERKIDRKGNKEVYHLKK